MKPAPRGTKIRPARLASELRSDESSRSEIPVNRPSGRCRRSVLVKDADSPVTLVAAFEQIRNGKAVQILERFDQSGLQRRCHLEMVAMSAAERLRNDFIHDAKLSQIFAGEPQRFGGFVGITGSAIGVLTGYVIISNINILERWIRIITGVRLWQSSSYILKYIPNEVNWPNVIWIIISAVAGCCLGALLPAIVAARTKPVDILRYE